MTKRHIFMKIKPKPKNASFQKYAKIKNLILTNTTIHNFFDYPVNDLAIQAFEESANFVVTQNRVPNGHIISQIEFSTSILPENVTNKIRQNVVKTLRSLKLHSLKNLKQINNIIILQSDNGNATAILNSSDYIGNIGKLFILPD